MAKSATQERERKYVNALVRVLEYTSPDYVTEVDRDIAGLRHKSNYDFLVSRGGYVVFIEAKVGAGVLSDVQKLFQARCKRAGTTYIVLRFSDDGKSFICSNLTGLHKVATFKAEKFFAKGSK